MIAVAELLTDCRADSSKERDNWSQNIPPKLYINKNKCKAVMNLGSDYGGNRNQPSHFCKNYENRKKGVPYRDGCYLCRETTHAAHFFPTLSKLGAMVADYKHQEQAIRKNVGHKPTNEVDRLMD